MDPVWCDFAPRLSAGNCARHSPKDIAYNCLAFAAGDLRRWWEPYVIPPVQPGVYWPPGVDPDNSVDAWCDALGTEGFRRCDDGSLEEGYVKVAVFGRGDDATHAARQLSDGRWVSKLGDLEDIVHASVEAVGGGTYGEVAAFLSRPRSPGDP